MCLAKVYTFKKNEPDQFLTDGIAQIENEAEEVCLVGLLGERTVLKGTIVDMNLVNSVVRIEVY